MEDVTWTTLGLIMLASIVAVMLLNRYTARREAERAEEYRKAAALRGWQLEFDGIEYRYSGTTEGVPWMIRVGHYRRHDRNKRPMLWQTTAVKMDDGALVIWPDFGQGMDAIRTPGVPQFVLNLTMLPVANALGAPVADGSTLAAASAVAEGPGGFLFRGTDPIRLKAWLANGAAEALDAERGWLANQDTPHHLIVAVLWRHGLQLATPYGSNDYEQMQRVARVGARLANAARTDSA